MTKTIWVQEWIESERGWGTRPDGFTLHLQRADIGAHLKAMRAREMEGKSPGYVPDEYSRPSGEPFTKEVPDEVAAKITGTGLWVKEVP